MNLTCYLSNSPVCLRLNQLDIHFLRKISDLIGGLFTGPVVNFRKTGKIKQGGLVDLMRVGHENNGLACFDGGSLQVGVNTGGRCEFAFHGNASGPDEGFFYVIGL